MECEGELDYDTCECIVTPEEQPCEGVPQLNSGEEDASGQIDVKPCVVTNNGVKYCGTRTAKEQTCKDNKWYWEFRGVACDASLPKPEGENITSNGGCFYKEEDYSCEFGENNQPQWVSVGISGEWKPTVTGNNCEDGLTRPQGQDTFCDNCKLKGCASGSVLNTQIGGKQCLRYGMIDGVYSAYVNNANSRCEPPWDFPSGFTVGPYDSESVVACNSDHHQECSGDESEVVCSGGPNLIGSRKIWIGHHAEYLGNGVISGSGEVIHDQFGTIQEWCRSRYALEYANIRAVTAEQLRFWAGSQGCIGSCHCDPEKTHCRSRRINNTSNTWACYQRTGDVINVNPGTIQWLDN